MARAQTVFLDIKNYWSNQARALKQSTSLISRYITTAVFNSYSLAYFRWRDIGLAPQVSVTNDGQQELGNSSLSYYNAQKWSLRAHLLGPLIDPPPWPMTPAQLHNDVLIKSPHAPCTTLHPTDINSFTPTTACCFNEHSFFFRFWPSKK